MPTTEVYWQRQKRSPLPALEHDEHADVVIVGGGLAGLMCARALQRRGREVVLLEKDFCGAYASGRSSGFITPDAEIELGSLIKNYGPDRARALWEFVLSGVEDIREVVKRHRIDCGMQEQDSLFIALTSSAVKRVQHEHAARRQVGYDSTLYDRAALPAIIGSTEYHAGVRYPGTFGIDPFHYCDTLKRELIDQGVRIYEQTPVTKLHAFGVTARGHTVRANHVIVCTDRFLPELGLLPNQTYHVQTFLAVTKPLPPAVRQRLFPAGPLMVWDTKLVYNYFRPIQDGRLLIGGSDLIFTYTKRLIDDPTHATGHLATYLQRQFPDFKFEIEYQWGGLIGVSKDLVPIVGSHQHLPNVHFAGAATGLSWAAALGRYLSDKIVDGRDELDQQFSPKRKFPIGPRLQAVIQKPAAFAISHGITKYF